MSDLYRRNAAQWSLVTAPTQEPITVADAKAHARITSTTEDGVISNFIRAAREAAEDWMSRGLFTQTWKLTLDEFAEVIWLPRAAPLQSATIQYYDTNGSLQTLATSVYDVDTNSRPGRIVRAANQTWPSLQSDRRSGRLAINYVIGWASVATVPERIKQGLRMYVTAMDADRAGSEAYAKQARESALDCWNDRVEWIEPVPYCFPLSHNSVDGRY